MTTTPDESAKGEQAVTSEAPWKSVPLELTDAMLEAVDHMYDAGGCMRSGFTDQDAWRAMVLAAPEKPPVAREAEARTKVRLDSIYHLRLAPEAPEMKFVLHTDYTAAVLARDEAAKTARSFESERDHFKQQVREFEVMFYAELDLRQSAERERDKVVAELDAERQRSAAARALLREARAMREPDSGGFDLNARIDAALAGERQG